MKKGTETMPNPKVKAKANRRRFGKDDILQILGEADNAGNAHTKGGRFGH